METRAGNKFLAALFTSLTAILLAIVLCGIAPTSAQAASTVVSGTDGTCTWAIDTNGKLTVKPTKGSSGTLEGNCPWTGNTGRIKTAVFSKGVKAGTSMEGMFAGCLSLTSVDFSNLDTSNVTSMDYLFNNCFSLKSVDLSNFNLSKVSSMQGMFYDCESLASVKMPKSTTADLKNMGTMFYDCESLTSLDLSNFTTAKTTDMNELFSGCKSLTSLNIANFSSSSATEMSNFITDCSKLSWIKVGSKFSLKGNKLPGGNWYSSAAKKNFSNTEVTNRANIADTYTLKYDLSKASAKIADKVFTGSALKPAATVKYAGKTLKAGTDYTITYKNNTNAGTASATITGTGRYFGTKTVKFKITKKSIAKATVASISPKLYTGSAIKPTPTVKLGGKTLKANTNYTITYKNNVKTGMAKIIFTGKGNYTGSKTVTFKIAKGTWKKVVRDWKYRHPDGTYAKNGWEKIDGKWYLFNKSGYMLKGWQNVNGKWYFLENSGARVQNKWIGNYYLQADGTMAVNKWIGKYHVNKLGKWDKTKK